MNKSSIIPLPKFFDRYINLVKQENLIAGLEQSLEVLEKLNWETLNAIGEKVYAPEKWTLSEVFQHLIDNERIQSTRALRIARNEKIAYAGYDENEFAANSFAKDRKLHNVVEELMIVRKSTIHLFKSFREEQVYLKGDCSGIEISVLGLGFQIVGHQIHHLNVIEERYYSLA